MSDVAQLMRAANPVPDSEAALPNDELDALLLLTQSRSGNMDVQELTKPVEPEKRQRSGWLVAAAAFALVIVVVGAAMLLARPADELPPATTPPTTQAVTPTTEAAVEEAIEEPPPTTVAAVAEPEMTDELLALLESYEAAFNDGDADSFRSLFSVDARREDSRDPGNTVSVDRIVDEMLWLGVRESSLDLDVSNCVATDVGADCEAAYSGPVETAMYETGLLLRTYQLWVEDGKITRIKERCDNGDCRIQMSVVRWVQETHRVRLIDWWPVLAGDDAELWVEYAPLWAEAGRPIAP